MAIVRTFLNPLGGEHRMNTVFRQIRITCTDGYRSPSAYG